MGTPVLSSKRGRSPQIFGPCLLWPNGWMDQDRTWHGGTPQPKRLCVRWVPRPSPKRGRSPLFSAHVYCGQTAGWIKMALVIEVGLSPGDFVLDGDTAPPQKCGGAPFPIFGPFLLWPNGWMHQDAAIGYEGRPQPRGLCVRWDLGPSSKGGGRSPTISPNIRPMSIAAKRLHRSRCHLIQR